MEKQTSMGRDNSRKLQQIPLRVDSHSRQSCRVHRKLFANVDNRRSPEQPPFSVLTFSTVRVNHHFLLPKQGRTGKVLDGTKHGALRVFWIVNFVNPIQTVFAGLFFDSSVSAWTALSVFLLLVPEPSNKKKIFHQW